MFEAIQKLFTEDHGVYSNELQFKTIMIVIAIIIFFNVYFKGNYGFVIILLVFALYIANMYVNVTENKVNDTNHLTLIKLQNLQKAMNNYTDTRIKLIKNSGDALSKDALSKLYKNNDLDSLYIDSNLISFLYSIIKLSEYNEHEYYSLLNGTNNILRIKKEIEMYFEANGEYPVNTSEMFQSAIELRSKTINNMHNFIYSVPKMSIMYKYIDDSINRYSILISRVTDSINYYYKENIRIRGITSTTNYVSYNKTKPYDIMDNHSVIPGKQHDKLIKIYV